MKLRNLLFCGVCALSITFGFAQNQTFPFTLTTADGLPAQTTAAANSFSSWVSPTYTFDEPVSSFRLTVTHTSWQDAYNTSTNGGRGYIFFTMGEFYLYDAAGNQVELTEENFYGNATESPATNDGVIGNLCDGDISTHYHTQYSATEEPRPIGREYYLEITLPEPMQSFSFGFAKRSNSANIPSEIIVTKGGVDADPYAEFGFQLGEKTTELEGGGLYVFADEGQIKSDAWEGELTTYLATGKDPRYASPAGTDKYYRIRRTANVDCIFEAVPAGEEGKFYLKSYLGGSYIKAANVSDGSVFIEQAGSFAEAGKFYLDEEGYLVCNNHYYATNAQETLVAYNQPVRVMSIYKASINTTFLLKDLSTLITDAEKALADNKEALTGSSDGEIEALEAALADAKKVTDANSAEEISVAKSAVEEAAISFMKLYIYYYLDYIQELLDEDNFGLGFGQYPSGDKPKLEAKLEELQADEENRSFASLEDISNYVSQLKDFMGQIKPIQEYDTLPQTIVAADGENQLGKLVDYTGYPNVTSNTNKYVYTSKTFVLEEPIEKLYVTFVHTNDGDHGGGYECTALANFALFDENGKEVDLASTDFETNAQESSEGPMEGICDKYDDGTPDVSTYWHSLWSSSDMSTGEHYICVTLPQKLSAFSFQYITRGTGIAPKEIVVGTEPYHWTPSDTIALKGQITTLAELNPNKYYLLWGNIYKVSDGAGGTGFYEGLASAYGTKPYPAGAFQVIPGENGGYYIHFVTDDIYLDQPTGSGYINAMKSVEDAGEFFFTESENLADAFKIWAGPTEADEADTKYMLQDWSGKLGYYQIRGEGFESDDTDGESDWTIFEVEAPEYYVVNLNQITKSSQLNTNEVFALYGNLGKLNSDYGTPGGFYADVKAIGENATNFALFKLEESKEGSYKIHFLDNDVYLKTATAWTDMTVTDKVEDAGDFSFAESKNIADAFIIYLTGTFDKDGVPVTGYNVLQDWGNNGMGIYPIASFDENDPDGEGDWYIYKVGEPEFAPVSREDYLGAYEFTWNSYWTTTEIKSFQTNLMADPESEDGVILDNINGNGPVKGVFDGESRTITFPTGQLVGQTDQWDVTFMTLTGYDIDFFIHPVTNEIKYNGLVGIQNVSNSGGDNGGWHFISASWVKLVPVGGDDRIDQPIVDNASEAEVVSVSYFTVGGQAVAEPVPGVNIVRTVLSDGTVKTAKVLVR